MKKWFYSAVLLLCSTYCAGGATTYQTLKVPANPNKGFQWAYYLEIPASVKLPAVLLVCPNNTGNVYDDISMHDYYAFALAQNWTVDPAAALRSPILVPVFPRPASHPEIYTQALDRNTILTKLPGLERLDLQLIAMVEDARAQLSARGITIDSRFWMWGFSASGSFVSRFTALHPNVVKAASIGSPGLGPIMPVAQWKGETLNYPYGIADLRSLVGQPFDTATFPQVPLQIYIGDNDYNIYDSSWKPDTDPDQAMLVRMLGPPLPWVWYANYEAVYGTVTSLGQFQIFPGVAHALQPYDYYVQFFERNRFGPATPAPKLRLYQSYLPHVECGSSKTTLSIANTYDGVPASGELQLFVAGNAAPVQVVPVAMQRVGRQELAVCTATGTSQQVEWVKLVADSGFLTGQAKYAAANGDSANLPVTMGITQGVLTGPRNGASTVIGLLNGTDSPAVVRLWAYDASGNELTHTVVAIDPASKLSGSADTLFGSALPALTHVHFFANQKIAAYWVAKSADGTVIDSLPAQPDYGH
jgi:hypothetical protein